MCALVCESLGRGVCVCSATTSANIQTPLSSPSFIIHTHRGGGGGDREPQGHIYLIFLCTQTHPPTHPPTYPPTHTHTCTLSHTHTHIHTWTACGSYRTRHRAGRRTARPCRGNSFSNVIYTATLDSEYTMALTFQKVCQGDVERAVADFFDNPTHHSPGLQVPSSRRAAGYSGDIYVNI